MNREDFYEILESALLAFDEVSEEALVNRHGIGKSNSRIGIKLCSYLKSIKSQEVKNGDKF